MNKYILDLKTDKVKDLWLALSERDFLCFDKKSDVKVNFKKKVKGKSSGKMPFKSRARLDSALNRIEDTLEYMNTISLGSTINKRAAFDFYDFINNECVVIDCIEKVAEIFGMNKEIAELKKTNEIFKMKGTDNDFVKYIRSLSSVHPLETAGHPNYNGYENFHCSPRVYWDYSSFDNRDLTIVVYDAAVNEDDFITIGIKISDFVDYLNKWIGFIDEIIFAIKKYEKKSVEEYRNIPMKSVTDFAMYSEYIAYLKSEYIKRGNAHQLECFDDYIRVFDTGMSHPENKLKCELYKNAIKLAMDFLAKRLQNMDKGKGETTGIKYDVPWNYTELFIELHWPDNLKANEHNIRYCIEKMVCRSDSFNDRMEEIKDWINQYVKFDNTESYNEMYTLVMTALYLNSLNNSCVLNRNIPNELLYRKKILTEKEYLELIDISNYNHHFTTLSVIPK